MTHQPLSHQWVALTGERGVSFREAEQKSQTVRLLEKFGLGSKYYSTGVFIFNINVSVMHRNETMCLKSSLGKCSLLESTGCSLEGDKKTH